MFNILPLKYIFHHLPTFLLPRQRWSITCLCGEEVLGIWSPCGGLDAADYCGGGADEETEDVDEEEKGINLKIINI